jgi:hypothetical protein
MQRFRIALRHFLGEIAVELAPQKRIVRHGGIEQIAIKRELGIGQEDGKFRPRQRQIAFAPLGQRNLVRQIFHGAIEMAAFFQKLHQPLLETEILEPAPLRQ